MRIDEATNIYVGTTQATKACIGTRQIWPVTPNPDSVEYSIDLNSNWGQNVMTDGGHYNITGSRWFAAFINSSNYTSQYTWSISGDMTLTDTDVITGNPNTTVGAYKYSFGGNAASLALIDPIGNRTIMTVTFN